MITPNSPRELSNWSDYVLQEIRKFARPQPPVIWHYTNGRALIDIMSSQTLWSTQVSCLNDLTEIRYSVKLLLDALRIRAESIATNEERILRDRIEAALSIDTVPASEWFLACFSEDGDDLSQWRAYAGGEGGYAIGIDCNAIRSWGDPRQFFLTAVNYERSRHTQVAQAIAAATYKFFLDGLRARPGEDPNEWASVFLQQWGQLITYLAPILKDPSFAGEREWRIVHRLTPDDAKNLRYSQKATLLARHLPIALRNPAGSPTLLPITSIRVGPCRHKNVSQVSAADMLLTHGFQNAANMISSSAIPYQQP